MTRAAAIAGLVLASCGGPQQPARATERAAPNEAVVAADATMADVIVALRSSLRARGHVRGECFLAWDVPSSDTIRVRVGEQERSAALSCGGLREFAALLEGRCPFMRMFWLASADLPPQAMTFYFAPAGRAYGARPMAVAGVGAPAARALFDDPEEDVQLVLGVPLDVPPDATPREGSPPAGIAMTPARDNPLEDPEIARALQQLVQRMQECGEEDTSLVLEWSVEPSGEIASIAPITTTASEETVTCAVELLSELSFPGHDGDAIDYCVPVLLARRFRPE
jgi:hypothetical protein